MRKSCWPSEAVSAARSSLLFVALCLLASDSFATVLEQGRAQISQSEHRSVNGSSISTKASTQLSAGTWTGFESDVVLANLPGIPVPMQLGHLQCMGKFTKLSKLSTSVYAESPDGGLELKHGWVDDPAGGKEKVSYFSIRATDPDTAGEGNKRCEHAYTDKEQLIPWDQDFWFGISARTSSQAGASDQQVIWQWHDGSSTTGLSPYLAAVLSGDKLTVVLRSNQQQTISSPTTKVIAQVREDRWQPNQWRYFLVKARLDSANNAASKMQIWLDKKLILNYEGPLGYHYTPLQDYVKVGVYHWTNNSNAWSAAQPKREVWIKGPVLVKSPSALAPKIMEDALR